MDYLQKYFLVTCLCFCMKNVMPHVYLLEDAIYKDNLESPARRNKRQTHPASTIAKFAGPDDVFTPIIGQIRQPLHSDDRQFNAFPSLADTVDLTQPQDATNTLVDYLTPPSPNFQHPPPTFNPTPNTIVPSTAPLLPSPTPDFSNPFGSASQFTNSFQAPAPSHTPQARELSNGISVDRPYQPTLVNDQGKWDLGYDASEILNPPVENNNNNNIPTRHLEDSLGPPPNFRRPSSLPSNGPSFAASQDSPVSFSNHNQFRDFNQGHSNNFPASPPHNPFPVHNSHSPHSPHNSHIPHSSHSSHSPRHVGPNADIIWGSQKPNSQPPNVPFFNALDSPPPPPSPSFRQQSLDVPPPPPPSFRQQNFNSFTNDPSFKYSSASQATFTTKAPPPYSNFDSFVPQGSVRDNGFLTPPSESFPNQHTKRQSELYSLHGPPKFFLPPGTRYFQTKRQSVDGAGLKRRTYKKRRSDDEDDESREAESSEHVKAPVYSYVKTDKHGHFKWGVRQGVPSDFK